MWYEYRANIFYFVYHKLHVWNNVLVCLNPVFITNHLKDDDLTSQTTDQSIQFDKNKQTKTQQHQIRDTDPQIQIPLRLAISIKPRPQLPQAHPYLHCTKLPYQCRLFKRWYINAAPKKESGLQAPSVDFSQPKSPWCIQEAGCHNGSEPGC